MNTYLILIQTNANTFEIKDYSAETSSRLYPKYRKDGIALAIREWSADNYAFLTGLKFNLENA